MNNPQEKKASLKDRFGKFAMSPEALMQTMGGHSPVFIVAGELYYGYSSCHEIAMETGASGICRAVK